MNNLSIVCRRIACIVAIFLCVAGSSSCTEQPLTEAEEREVLKARVQALWDAVIAVDFDKVYEFTTPAYRKAYSKAHFFSRYGNQLDRKSITIKEIVFQNPERTTAKVTVDLKFSTRGFSTSEIVHTSANVFETWIKEDGEWWRVEPS